MKVNNIIYLVLTFSLTFFSYADDNKAPQFSDYPTKISTGHFVKKIILNKSQEHYSEKWKELLQSELLKPVNFAGHYRIFLSRNGENPKECGNDGWVCGWIIDKTTGMIVSELPIFNANTKYYSTTDNGTPSPDVFDPTYYPDSALLLIYGENKPSSGIGDSKCANNLYAFQENKFKKILSSGCHIE